MTTGRTVEEMRVVMDAETARLHRKLQLADQRMAKFQRDTAARLKAFDGYFKSAGAGIAAIGAGLGTGQIIEYANAWTRVQRSLTASEDIFGMRLHSSEELLKLANEARVDLESYSKMYQRTAAAIRDYGMGADAAAKVTSALSMALKLGGTTAEEQASVLLQFSQALNKGKLDGDEFRTVMEAAPVVVQLLSDKLKISKGDIINWAKSGKLGVKELVGSLVDGGAKIERIFRAMPTTVDEAFQVLRNSVIGYVGRMDEASGASQKFVSVLAMVSNNIDTVGNSALVLGASLLAAFGPRVIASVAGFGAATATAMGPLGMLAAVIGGGTAALQLFGDKIAVTDDGMVTLKDTAAAFVQVVGDRLAPLAKVAGDAWATAVQSIQQALAGLPVSLDDVIGAVRFAVNKTIGLFAFAGKAIVVAFETLPAAIGELMIQIVNDMIGKIEYAVGRIKDALNVIPGINIEAKVDLGRLENPLAGSGAKAREGMAKAGEELGRDFVGEMGAAIKSGTQGIFDDVAKQARANAANRQWAAGTTTQRAITPGAKYPTSTDSGLAEKIRRADDKMRALYTKSLDAAEKYRAAVVAEYTAEVAKFRDMLDKKLISQEQFDLARQRLAAIASKQMLEAIEKEYRKLREVTDILSSGMSDAFDKFTETGKFSFKDMTKSILADMAKLIWQRSVMETLFGSSGKGFGLAGDLLGVGAGATSILGFADGGRPPIGRPSWVGENGPELFVPDMAGTVVPNHQLGGGGGPVSLSLSIDARGATRDTLPALERQMADLRANLPRMILQTVTAARSRNILRP